MISLPLPPSQKYLGRRGCGFVAIGSEIFCHRFVLAAGGIYREGYLTGVITPIFTMVSRAFLGNQSAR